MSVEHPDWKNRILALKGPIAVFGAGGFIGAGFFRELLETRQDAFGITHQSFVPWRMLGLRAPNVLHCDVTDPDAVDRLFRRYRFQTIFCFTAYGAYSRQTEVPRIYQTNVLGLVHVLEAASRFGFAALVHAGSSSEYGLNCRAPKEDAQLIPNSHYAVSKTAASHLIGFQGQVARLPVVNLRLYSVYGPWEESDRLIPRLVEHALQKRLPPLVEPEISRDFLYVEDAFEATIAAAEKIESVRGQSINIGTGKKTTIREVVETARTVFGVSEPPEWGGMANRAWDLKDWYSDPSHAAEVLGWRARTDLASGLKKTADWIQVHGAAPRVVSVGAHEKTIRLSAVIACYRDVQAIPILHEELTQVFRKLGVEYEIIFVNDASPDDTDSVLGQLCRQDEHVIAVEHSRNFGSQNAFLDGMSVATGDGVILLDGDLQDPPAMIEKFFQKWQEGFDVVYGRRVQREGSWVLQVCYKAFYRVFRRLAYVSIPVDAGDFSLMDRKVVDQMLAFPETDQFLRGLRAWAGYRQAGVDYVRPERRFGTTTNNWRKNFWWARKAIFSFSFAPMEMLMYGGIFLTGVSFLALAAQVVARIYDPTIPHGIATVIVLTLFFGGLNMLGLSILGEYLGKVFEETKRRPKYIRRAIRIGNRHLTTADAIDSFLASRQVART